MIKKILILFVFVSSFFPFVGYVYADSNVENNLDTAINDIVEGLDLSSLNEWLSSIFEGENITETINKAIKGEYFTTEQLLKAVTASFKSSLLPLKKIFIQLLSIIIICSVLTAIRPNNGQIKDVIFLVCYLSVCLSLFTLVINSISKVKNIIVSVSSQIDGIFPIILTIMTALGAKSPVTVYQPIYLSISTLILGIINKILFPIITIMSAIALLASLNEKFSLKRFFLFMGDAFKWIVGITVTVFSFLGIVKSLSASSYDTFSIRALKYTIGNSFPLIGGFAKEGIDVVLTSAILIKNALGTISIILLFFVLLTPFLEILLLSLFLKFLSAICEPIADNRIIQLLTNFSKVISLLATLLIMIFIIYFLVLLLVILAQNGLAL